MFWLGQAVSDLSAVAGWTGLGPPDAIRALGPDRVAAFESLRRADPLAPAAEGAIRDALQMAAASPGDNPDGCVLASAVLLGHALRVRDRRENWLWAWEAAEVYRSARPPVRAALMNGFRIGRAIDLVAEEVRPTAADCATDGAAAVSARLVPVARGMTPATRRTVAAADYGQGIETHLAALDTVLARDGCRMTDEEYRYPAEVVQLTAHVADSPGFAECTALLLIGCLADGDGYGHASFRWPRLGDHYRGLPDPARRAILDAIRHLYETDEDFGFSLPTPAPTIPWFPDPPAP